MAGAIGNTNHVRHGLTTGALPKGAGYVKRITNELRGCIERSVIDASGEVSLHDAAVIQTAIRWERHALLAQRWLRNEADKLTPDQRLAFSRDIARASAERDKCLKILKLDVRPGSDPWGEYDRALRAGTLFNASTQPDASAATQGDVGADSRDDDIAVNNILSAEGPTR